MRAMRFHDYGGPGVLRLEEVERPAAGPGELLVRVAGTSFNPVDAAIRAGFLRAEMPIRLPFTPGLDVAGTTERGRRVIGMIPMLADGASAEWVAVGEAVLADAPRSIPLTDAAAVPAVALTAWQALSPVRPEQTVLINGAGGAVGAYAVQFAKRAGATVIAVTTPRGADLVASLGADRVVGSVAGLAPVDLVLNLVRVPAATLDLAPLVRDGGLAVSTATPVPGDPARGVRSTQLSVRGDAAQLAEIVALIDSGALRVDIGGRYPLDALAEVHSLAEFGGLARGKTVIEC